MRIIAKASFYLSSKTLLTLHYSPVYPCLMYCNVAWSSICCSKLNCIYLLPKCIERRIAKARYLTNTAPLYLANLQSLAYTALHATFMYSYHHNGLRNKFRNFFK